MHHIFRVFSSRILHQSIAYSIGAFLRHLIKFTQGREWHIDISFTYSILVLHGAKDESES